MSITLSAEWDDELDAVFSGYGPMATARDVMQSQLSEIADMTEHVYQLRRLCAISGAMRYPWSQEAPMRASWRVAVG